MAKFLLTQSKTSKWQVLSMDLAKPYLVSQNKKWQMLLGRNAAFTTSSQIIKIAAEFNKDTYNSLRIAAYLFDPQASTISAASSCVISIYKVTTPAWTDSLQFTGTASLAYNSYFFLDVPASSIPSVDMFGEDTLMIEATIVRLGVVYRDRVYVNHLGIVDNVDRLRKEVEFLDLTKVDE